MILNPSQKILFNLIRNNFYFNVFSIFKLPLLFFTGIKIKYLDEKKCITSVKLKYLNKNPFSSIYFAVLGMAAELSTGVYAVTATKGHNIKIKTIIISMSADFKQKAKGRIFFECVDAEKLFKIANKVIKQEEPINVTVSSIGKNERNEIVASFKYTWLFKRDA